MCMGYAKDIKAWACPQEMERREAALHQWGDLLHLEDDAAQASDSAPPVADTHKRARACTRTCVGGLTAMASIQRLCQ